MTNEERMKCLIDTLELKILEKRDHVWNIINKEVRPDYHEADKLSIEAGCIRETIKTIKDLKWLIED